MSEYLEPYRRAVREFGPGFESLLWNSEESQRARFGALAASVELADRTIADLGAGTGDLLAWLHGQGRAMRGYVAVEGVAELAERIRGRIDEEELPPSEVVEADFARDEHLFERLIDNHGVDLVFFSGSLNTFAEKLAKRVLERAWKACTRRTVPRAALAFNFLSDLRRDRARERGDPARRFDTLGLVRWAAERTPVFAVRHDYLGDHDATIVMHAR